jgi:hypothetical protein
VSERHAEREEMLGEQGAPVGDRRSTRIASAVTSTRRRIAGS